MSAADLSFVGVSEDGRFVLLADAAGHHFRVLLDARLRAAVRQDHRRPSDGQPSMSPREVQALIRAGASADEVSELSGWPPEKVVKYEGPIVAEREFVASLATQVRLRSLTGSTLLSARVAERLAARGVDPATASWDAWRASGRPWTLQLAFPAGGRLREARWAFDLQTRAVSPEDDEARWLSGEEDLRPAPYVPLDAVPHGDEDEDPYPASVGDRDAVFDAVYGSGPDEGDRVRTDGSGAGDGEPPRSFVPVRPLAVSQDPQEPDLGPERPRTAAARDHRALQAPLAGHHGEHVPPGAQAGGHGAADSGLAAAPGPMSAAAERPTAAQTGAQRSEAPEPQPVPAPSRRPASGRSRSRREAKAPQRARPRPSGHTGGEAPSADGVSAPAASPADAPVTAAPTPPESPSETAQPQSAHPSSEQAPGGRTKAAPSARKGRAAVPSWDDIMFGAKRD